MIEGAIQFLIEAGETVASVLVKLENKARTLNPGVPVPSLSRVFSGSLVPLIGCHECNGSVSIKAFQRAQRYPVPVNKTVR